MVDFEVEMLFFKNSNHTLCLVLVTIINLSEVAIFKYIIPIFSLDFHTKVLHNLINIFFKKT